MKATELRIGNYVYAQSGKLVINRDSIYKIENINLQSAKKYEPIPLTEEWLLIFGFKKDEYNDNSSFYYTFKGFRLNCNMGFLTLYNSNELADFRPIELKHVHQLQNMFFALCGEELELKSI